MSFLKYLLGGAAVVGVATAVSSKSSGSSKQVSQKPAIPSPIPNSKMLEPGDRLWFWNGKISRTDDIPQQEWFGTTAPNDYAGHGKEIFYFVIYDNEIRRGRPQMKGFEGSYAWLHNNPGNITGPGPDIGQFAGKFGWHKFLIFPNFAIGFDAIPKYLKTNPRYKNVSVLDAFRIYAPKGDGANDPDRYAAEVANAAGVNVLSPIQDLLKDSRVKLVQEKIAQIEGTIPGVIMSRTDPNVPSVISSLLSSGVA